MKSLLLGLAAGLAAALILPIAASAADDNSLVLNSADNDTYSKLYLSASAYVVKDRDFSPEQPRLGLFTTWMYDPVQNNRFEVNARYCVPDQGIDTDRAVLRQVDIIDSGRVLLSLNRETRSLPARRETVRPAYYAQNYSYRPAYFGYYGRGYFGHYGYPLTYVPTTPTFYPEVTCAAGATGFDLKPVAGKLATLPDRTLQVKLHFSNGEVSGWQLGSGTVRELKRLVAVREELGGR